MSRTIRHLIVLIALIMLSGCQATEQGESASTAIVWSAEGWDTSSPEEQGVRSEDLAGMLASIQEEDANIDSITIVRNGTLLLDAYLHPFQPDAKHPVLSVTKSIISILVGIAIDLGEIEGVSQPIAALLPQRPAEHLGENKADILLEDVLTMSTGLACEDSYLYRWRGLTQMRRSSDWVQFVIDLPMAAAPGTRFEYCNGASYLLSAILQANSGETAFSFAQEYLFRPLGIVDVDWESSPEGYSLGWSGLSMRPRDMAKIGLLYLDEGQWEGRQVVSEAWVEASTRSHIAATLQDGYGYQWWVDSTGIYMALGYGGQFIFVVPDKEMVVVFTSDLPEEAFYLPQQLLNDFIIPAAGSTAPLAQNPAGVAALRDLVASLAESR